MLAPKLHKHLIKVAGGVSPTLKAHIAEAPAWFPDRPDRGVVGFLARAVTGQQVSAKAAASIWARVEQAAESQFGEFFHAKNEAALRGCGLSRNKVKAMLHIGEAHAAGRLDHAEVRALDHIARSARLTEIWGIGQWTCDMLAIFYFHELDIWPEGDLAVIRSLKSFTRRKPARVAAEFAPYRSILALYMWRKAGGAV